MMQETCEKNKKKRELVKFPQTTGSRSYMVVIDNLVSKPWSIVHELFCQIEATMKSCDQIMKLDVYKCNFQGDQFHDQE